MSPSPDANSRKQESEWKDKAKVELEEWHTRQDEQLEKTKVNNRYKCIERV